MNISKINFFRFSLERYPLYGAKKFKLYYMDSYRGPSNWFAVGFTAFKYGYCFAYDKSQ